MWRRPTALKVVGRALAHPERMRRRALNHLRPARRTATKVLERLRCERGNILLLFGGFLPAMIAMFALVIGGGEFFAKSRQAQNAANAAALAGAQNLCPNETELSKLEVCADSARTTASDYATLAGNMPEGTPNAVPLTEDNKPEETAANPFTKLRVTVDADAPIFFASALKPLVASTKPVGRCLTTDTGGQCATAAANQETKVIHHDEEVIHHPAEVVHHPATDEPANDAFAFAMGTPPSSDCKEDFKLNGTENVFEGTIQSNEQFSSSGQRNAADLLITGTQCSSPSNIDDDYFRNREKGYRSTWPYEPPPIINNNGTPCIEGGKVASTSSPTITWRASNPPGIYCRSDEFLFGPNTGTFAGYTWVAPRITSQSGNTFSPYTETRWKPLLMYGLSHATNNRPNAVDLTGQRITFTGYVIAPNAGVGLTGSSSASIEGYLQALTLDITGSGTTFKGTGPGGGTIHHDAYDEVIKEAWDETIPGWDETVPTGPVKVELDD